jgi:methylthioribose-1-phosphate isomerase
MIKTIEWSGSNVLILDQRLLPQQEVYQTCTDYREVAEAIRNMVIRGAPAIAVAAAMGIALGMLKAELRSRAEMDAEFQAICALMAGTRPTAVNLFWAVERMKSVYRALAHADIEEVRAALVGESRKIFSEDIAANKMMGCLGQVLLPDGACVLTHCNAGALATAGYGTALGVIRAAVEAGKHIRVFADETRPYLQGARLTAWELTKENIPVTVITDSMAGHMMHGGKIDCVVVGADRIAANGDVANKIGTYSIAVLAKENQIPFFVVAPVTSFDLTIPDGSYIPIEERDPEEVRKIQGVWITSEDVPVANPSFDVTPHRYVTAIVTDCGVARPPYMETLARLVKLGLRKARG